MLNETIVDGGYFGFVLLATGHADAGSADERIIRNTKNRNTKSDAMSGGGAVVQVALSSRFVGA